MSTKDIDVTVDLLHHVGEVNFFHDDVAEWTAEQVHEVENWASAKYLSSFTDVEVPNKPEVLSSTHVV